jgi:hypothetical protein
MSMISSTRAAKNERGRQLRQEAEMKSGLTMCFLGFAVAFLNRPSAAGQLDVEVLTPKSSIESKCRSAVRAELKGPNCRQVYVYSAAGGSAHNPCIVDDWQQPYFVDKVLQCVARGGPGRAAR